MNQPLHFDINQSEKLSTIMAQERRLRIRVSLFAYAYEFKNDSMVDDHEFDRLCLQVNLNRSTGNREMDRWFRENFQPCTGMWIRNHPNINRLAAIHESLRK